MGTTARVASALLLAGLAGFVVLTVLAAARYPGGTFCDPDAAGYRFWQNFFCDLTQPVTQRGLDNAPARVLAKASFVCFSIALAPFWWLLATVLGGGRGRGVLVLGLVSAAGTNLGAWLPSAVSPLLHQMAVFLATLPGLGAALLGVTGCLSRRNAPEKRARLLPSGLLGLAALLFGAADAAYYAYAIAVPGCYVWLPVLQKLAALALMGWMLAIGREGLRA